jgi:hypothetical protein
LKIEFRWLKEFLLRGVEVIFIDPTANKPMSICAGKAVPLGF